MVVKTALRTFAVTAATGLLAAGATTGTAQAATAQPVGQDLYQGQVIAPPGLNVRTGASTRYRSVPPAVPYGTVVRIECKVYGENVDGNRLWYKLEDHRYYPGYITARYVDDVGRAPHFCSGDTDAQETPNAEPGR
jgi:hypothetical protein